MSAKRFLANQSALLVVDMQEKLLPVIDQCQQVQDQTTKLIRGAGAVGVRVLATEQYRKGLGATVPAVRQAMDQAHVPRDLPEKLVFSAALPEVIEALHRGRSSSVVVCGIEAHVCVLQTCLDLLDQGLTVGVVADAVGSRRPLDRDVAMARLQQAGVVPTTVESVLLEWVKQAGTPWFKAVLPLIK